MGIQASSISGEKGKAEPRRTVEAVPIGERKGRGEVTKMNHLVAKLADQKAEK